MFGIVFVSYRIPAQRLRDHFAWNDELYRLLPGVSVLAVVDRYYQDSLEFAFYASQLRFTEAMPVFSLSRTKNAGLRSLIASGCDPIAVTDVDFAWTPEAFHACRNVQPGRAVVPLVRMVRTFETRHQDALDPKSLDKGMTSTVSMRVADWRRVCYDETYVGYGGEDGKLVRDMQLLGIQVDRSHSMHHVAHNPAAPQVNEPGHGRADCWGRDTGFNPDMFAINRNLIERK